MNAREVQAGVFASAVVGVVGSLAACGTPIRQVLDAALDVMVPDGLVDAQVTNAPGIDSRSGRRIVTRREIFDGADGSRLDTGRTILFDQDRGEECSVERLYDGQLYCVPKAMAVATSPQLRDGLYADATCTTPIVSFAWAQCDLVAPTYASARVQECDPFRWKVHLFEVGVEYLGTIYLYSHGECTASTRPAAFKYYIRGDELLVDRFVRFAAAP